MSSPSTHRTIVVGYDGSPASRAAVDFAIDRTGDGDRLVLVHAYDVPDDFVGASYYNVMRADADENARNVVDALERDCDRLAGVAHEQRIALGRPAQVIEQVAEGESADEIVLGTRGVGRLRGLLGSVAHDVVHHADCPVTVIPERMVRA